jgi:hypothetical protein
MSSTRVIELVGLSKLDVLDLQSRLPAGSMTTGVVEESFDSYGDLGTISAIVVVSLEALRVLAVWAGKDRKTIKVRTQVLGYDPQGQPTQALTEFTIDSKLSDAEALKQLGSVLKIDLKGLDEL